MDVNNISVHVKRITDNQFERLQEYQIPIDSENTTVLEVLQYIQEEIDHTLGIRYGCRFKQCGLCAMKINGKPLMACMTKIKDKMIIEPLDNIPVQKDLIVERTFITDVMKKNHLYSKELDSTKSMIASKKYEVLNKCTDCQSCLSVCPEFDYDNIDEFAGPLFFVKLAQLQNHPQNTYDYTEKAKQLGVEKCENCTCRCPYGIPIKKFAVDPFIQK